MKLGSLRSANGLDGELVVATQDLESYVKVSEVAPHLAVNCLREALEKWHQVEPELKKISDGINHGKWTAHKFKNSQEQILSCLPRTFLFADGSAFIHHIKLVRKARGAELPETLSTVPLMYQGEGGRFLAPTEQIPQVDFNHGTDFEAEIGVITDFVPMGTSADQALKHIRLVCLINDVSLRGLIPGELAQGFGFFQSKPSSTLSPFAVSPDELGEHWRDGKLHLPLNINLNNEVFGRPNATEMHFNFGQLIAHAARTRDLAPGTLVGSGTVSNEDSSVGSGCLAEKRTLEQIKDGKPVTSFMKEGDLVEIWMENPSPNVKGHDIFGRIAQRVGRAY
jgi:fumarylacetoacetate (FAA) hydrolase